MRRMLAGGAALVVLAGCAIVAGIEAPDVSKAKHHCINGTIDEDETDLDCGGKDCLKCGGDACTLDDECQTGACVAKACKLASCSDGIFDGYESALDCGDPGKVGCPGCAMGQNCWNGCNCASQYCDPDNHTCGDGTANCDPCADGVLDNSETGIDCGGIQMPPCERCPAGKGCEHDSDCETGLHCDMSTHRCST